MPVTIDGTSGITTPTYNGADTSEYIVPVTAFKNRIINGSMMIDQRNAGASVTVPGVTQTFGVDRWAGYCNLSSKFSMQQNAGSITPPAGFKTYWGITSLAATASSSGDYFLIQQNIEGFNTADLGFGATGAATVTLSFWVRSSLTGTFAGRLLNGADNRSYVFTYSISSANTWEYKTVTIAGDTSGTWVGATNGTGLKVSFDLGSGSSSQTTAGSWQNGAYSTVSGATSVVGTNGATFYITGVQLEKGSTATSFDYRPYDTELQLCQRYYTKYAFPVNTGVGASPLGTALSTTIADGYVIPCVPFRVTASSLSLTVSSLQIYTVSSGSVFSTGTWTIPYDTNAIFVPIRYTHGSAVFTLGASQLIVGNGTTGFLAISAEL